MKEKLIAKLGTFGSILYYLLLALISVLPIAILPVRGILSIILISVMVLIPATSVIFWLWGLVCAITGPQDYLAIIYYICFAVLFIPTFISIISGLFNSESQKRKDRGNSTSKRSNDTTITPTAQPTVQIDESDASKNASSSPLERKASFLPENRISISYKDEMLKLLKSLLLELLKENPSSEDSIVPIFSDAESLIRNSSEMDISLSLAENGITYEFAALNILQNSAMAYLKPKSGAEFLSGRDYPRNLFNYVNDLKLSKGYITQEEYEENRIVATRLSLYSPIGEWDFDDLK